MLGGVLGVGRIVRVGIVVIQDAEVGAGLRPKVVGLGRMNVRIAPAGSGQDVVIRGSVSDVLADVYEAAIHKGDRGSVDQAVDEGRVGVLIDGLNAAGDGGRLSPVVVFEGNDENVFDFPVILSTGARTAQYSKNCKSGKRTEIGAREHGNLQLGDWRKVAERFWRGSFRQYGQPTCRLKIRSRRMLRQDERRVKDWAAWGAGAGWSAKLASGDGSWNHPTKSCV